MVTENVNVKYGVIDNASNATDKITGSTKKLEKSTLLASASLAGLGFAVGKAIKSFANYQTKMISVGNLTGASADEVARMTDEVSKLSIKTAQPVGELADALFDVQSAGVAAGKSIKFLEVASKLAVAGVTDTKIAVDGLTSVINAYGLAAEDATDIADLFFAAQVEGKTTVAELADNIGQLAPIAKAAGLSLEEVFAATTTLTKSGIDTRIAVMALRGAITSIIKPTDEATKVAKKYGIELGATALETKGLAGVLSDMQKRTDGNIEAISEILPKTESLAAVLSLAGSQAGEFARQQEVLKDRTGATTEAFEKQTESIEFQLESLSREFEKFSNDTVAWWAPIITKTLQWVNALNDAKQATSSLTDEEKTRAEESFKNTKEYEEQLKERLKLARQEVEASEKNQQEIRGKVEWGRRAKMQAAEKATIAAIKNLEKEKETVALYLQWKKEEEEKTSTAIIKTKTSEKNDSIGMAEAMAKARIDAGKAAKEFAISAAYEEAAAIADAEEKKKNVILRILEENQQAIEEAIEKRVMTELKGADTLDKAYRALGRGIFETFKETLIAQLFAKQIADLASISTSIAVAIANPFLWGTIPGSVAQLGIVASQIAVGVAGINAITPKFANGGIVEPTSGGTNVIMGEAGETELGLPASKVNAFLDEANKRGMGGGAQTINLIVDGRQMAQVVTDHQRADDRRRSY